MARVSNNSRSGFTLIEAMLAIIVVGVGIVGVMQLQYVCTLQNSAATRLTVATMLATHIREMTTTLPFNDPTTGQSNFGPEAGETLSGYDDVDDFNNAAFSPPRDADRDVLDGFAGYRQEIRVFPINNTALSGNQTGAAITNSTYTGAVRVRVRVFDTQTLSGDPIYELSFVRVDQ